MTDGSPLHLWPQMGVYAGAKSGEFEVFVWTTNTYTDHKLGLPVTLGKWYGIEFDVDAEHATMRSLITDRATGDVLVDLTEDLTRFGAWDPLVDGHFDVESLFGGEGTAKIRPNLVVVDNIDVPAGNGRYGHDEPDRSIIGSGWYGNH